MLQQIEFFDKMFPNNFEERNSNLIHIQQN